MTVKERMELVNKAKEKWSEAERKKFSDWKEEVRQNIYNTKHYKKNKAYIKRWNDNYYHYWYYLESSVMEMVQRFIYMVETDNPYWNE